MKRSALIIGLVLGLTLSSESAWARRPHGVRVFINSGCCCALQPLPHARVVVAPVAKSLLVTPIHKSLLVTPFARAAAVAPVPKTFVVEPVHDVAFAVTRPPGAFWVSGFWHWTGGEWVWVANQWALAGHSLGFWRWDGSQWVWIPGR